MNEIVTYVRSKGKLVSIQKNSAKSKVVIRQKGPPRGVIVATGVDQIGWSFANKCDKFDKWKGIHIARTRAVHGQPHGARTPYDVAKLMPKVLERAQRAFAPKPQTV